MTGYIGRGNRFVANVSSRRSADGDATAKSVDRSKLDRVIWRWQRAGSCRTVGDMAERPGADKPLAALERCHLSRPQPLLSQRCARSPAMTFAAPVLTSGRNSVPTSRAPRTTSEP
jgi:hypothetical protein